MTHYKIEITKLENGNETPCREDGLSLSWLIGRLEEFAGYTNIIEATAYASRDGGLSWKQIGA